MFCIKHAALSVYLFCGIVNIIATDVRNIRRHIERKRQVEKIKYEIMKNLENKGLWTNNTDHVPDNGNNFGYAPIDKQGPDKHEYDGINRDNTILDKHQPTEPKRKRNPIISIGEPEGEKKDGCLRFSMSRISKENKNISSVVPIRVNLWVYIRKKRSRSSTNKQRRVGSKNTGKPTRGNERQKRYASRHRRKQKGRKIKLFVSNGYKRLSTMRMRIRRSDWHSIDLPISQFPEIIHTTDSFKICLQCKRCNKKVKVDLYRKKKSHNRNKPTIPFIHIETATNLAPRNIYRHKRSHKNRQHCKHSCCKLESFKIDITKTFPTILAPKDVLFTYCLNTCEADVRLHNTSVLYGSRNDVEEISESPDKGHHRQCLPQTYDSFSFLYLLPNSNVMFGTIPNMFPSSCRCSRSSELPYKAD